MSNQKEALDGEDACMLMHTALRKLCDSPITSAMYNLVHIIDVKDERFDPWRLFGRMVAGNLSNLEPAIDAVKTSSEQLNRRWNDIACDLRDKQGVQIPDNARATMCALACIMKCFDDDDLACMAGYLSDTGE